MCIAPNFIWVERGPQWEKQPVICRECWQCLASRHNDYVGRCLAEAAYSDWTAAITLTYATPKDGDLSHKVLNPSHWQAAIRAFRRRGHKTRYLTVGEYGKTNDRAHFHTLLFGKGKRPEIPHRENFHVPWWWNHQHDEPRGHIFCDWSGDEKAIRYVVKYLLKNEPGNYWFSPSKKPPLGAAFFYAKARESAALGVLPSSFNYLPPGGRSDRRYLLTGASRRYYLQQIVKDVCFTRPDIEQRVNEWVQLSLDKLDRWENQRSRHYDEEWFEAFAEQLEKARPSKWAIQRNMLDTSPESWAWL